MDTISWPDDDNNAGQLDLWTGDPFNNNNKSKTKQNVRESWTKPTNPLKDHKLMFDTH